jgi:hypothetical protein
VIKENSNLNTYSEWVELKTKKERKKERKRKYVLHANGLV